MAAVDDAVAQLRQFPESGPLVYRTLRGLSLHKFPYTLFYVYDPDRIRVIGVIHWRRDPEGLADARALTRRSPAPSDRCGASLCVFASLRLGVRCGCRQSGKVMPAAAVPPPMSSTIASISARIWSSRKSTLRE